MNSAQVSTYENLGNLSKSSRRSPPEIDAYSLHAALGLEPRTYQVIVRQQGTRVAEHTIKAPDALSAINQIERYYGDPVQMEERVTEDEDGHPHQIMLVSNWHGYTFEAVAIDTPAKATAPSIQTAVLLPE